MGLHSLHTAHIVDWWSHMGPGALLPTSAGLDHETESSGSSNMGPGQGTIKLKETAAARCMTVQPLQPV